MSVGDAELVLKTLNGDKNAFGALYDRYARLVRAICYDTSKDVAQAQDLAQEAFIRAYTRLDRLDDPAKFGAWMVSIAKNICREYRRGKYRDRHVLVGLDLGENQEKTGENRAKQVSDEQIDLAEAMEKLSEKEKMALHIYYLQENDAEEAQKILNMSRSAFYRLLAKARKKIEKYLNEKDQSVQEEVKKNGT